MKSRAVLLALLTALLVALSGAGLANAAPAKEKAPEVKSLTVVDSKDPVASTVLELSFTEPATKKEVEAAVSAVGADPSSVVIEGQVATASRQSAGDVSIMAGPSGQDLLCGGGKTWTDGNGSFTLQHQCGWTTVPWSWTMNKNLHSTVASGVSERGMDWWKNGVRQPRQAPHIDYYPNYIFHGTFSNSPTYTRIAYEDIITWRHNIAGGGTATVSIAGNFRFIR